MKNILKTYLQSTFLICVITLAVAGGGMSFVQKRFEIWLQKQPWPLKKSLDLLDESKLAPYKVVEKGQIKHKEVIASLGTEDYIQWVLEDTEATKDSCTRFCELFITYYDVPDRVVHVPDECYTGGGFRKLGTEMVTFDVELPVDMDSSHKDGQNSSVTKKIPGKYLVFGRDNANPWDRATKFPVLYLFNVNGEYSNTRTDTRMILNKNVFGKHSYYCKIEMAFRQNPVVPDKENAVKASQKLLSVILPILEQEHWPSDEQEKEKTGEQTGKHI